MAEKTYLFPGHKIPMTRAQWLAYGEREMITIKQPEGATDAKEKTEETHG